jgi:uncharacterized damage-inducible protein DinB
LQWATRNTIYNLDFVPDDKLDWKPAPTASSVLEIINHVLMPFTGMAALLESGEWKAEGGTATNRDEAKQALQQASDRYVAALENVKMEDFSRTLALPFGPMPFGVAVSIPVIDLIHHHGQIAYIQALLGDTESHLQM